MLCCVMLDNDSMFYVFFLDVNEVYVLYEEDGKKMRMVVRKSEGVKWFYVIMVNSDMFVIIEDEIDKIYLIKVWCWIYYMV